MFESFLKPTITTQTVSGSICTFYTQYAMPLKSHKIALTATQSGSGTPSPDNVRPINGYSDIHIQNTCGVNQWDEQWRKGYYDRNNQGAFVANNSYICNTEDIRIEPNTSYYWFIGISESYLQGRVLFFTADKQYISATEATAVNSVITTPNNCSYIRFYYYANGADYDNNCSINYPSTDTSYHAFIGQSFTIQIGSTVYGGEYDARTGVLTATKASVILDSSNVPTSEAYVQYNSATDVYSWTYDNILVGVTNQASVICDKLSLSADAYNRTSGGKFYCTGGLGERIYVSMEGSVVGSKAGMIQWLRDNTPLFVYELGTPQIIQLPPCPIDTLEGVNNIWADTGDTTLSHITIG